MKRKFLYLTTLVLSLVTFSTGFIKIDLSASITFSDFPEKNTKYELNLNGLPESETEAETETVTETELKAETEKAKKKKKKAEVQTEAQTENQTEAQTEVQTEIQTEPQTEVQTEIQTEVQTEPQTEVQTKAEASEKKKEDTTLTVPAPETEKQYLTKNEWSRPGDKVKKVEKIVIHYVGNPGSTAQDNRDYYESLKDSQDMYMSSNFIVGLEGEIIKCVPEKEVAYCTKDYNRTSLSIETCHLDSTGKYLSSTYISTVKLTAYLTEKYDIDRSGIVRHYDCTGKECPRYYVDHPKAWERFVNDVMKYRKLCKKQGNITDKQLKKKLSGLKDTYANRKAWEKAQKEQTDSAEQTD